MSWASKRALVQGTTTREFDEGGILFASDGGAAQPILGIFRAASVQVDVGTGQAISSTQPVLDVALADLPAPPTRRDLVTVAGKVYRVADIQPDGEGMATLFLNAEPV